MYFRFCLVLLPWWREIEFAGGTLFNADTFSKTSSLAQQGKNHLDSLSDKANISRYGSCWKNAIAELQLGCKILSEETQKDLALKLTDCFLQMSGYEPVKCEFPKSSCLQKLSDRAFNAYTEFYTHTHSICYFLQNQIWQEEAEKTVNKLSSTSTRVSQQLQESEKIQESLLNHQKESLFLQHDLMENSKGIAKFLQTSQQNLESIIGDFQSSTTEQKQLLLDIFDNLSSFKSWAINEMSWFSSSIFYIGAIIMGYIATSVSRTRSARIHIVVIFTLNFMFEGFLCSVGQKDMNSEINLFIATYTLYAWLWMVRKFCIFLAIIVVIYCALNYYNYNVLNYQLLLEIKKQNLIIIKYLSSSKQKDIMISNIPVYSGRSNLRDEFDNSDLTSANIRRNDSLLHETLYKSYTGCNQSMFNFTDFKEPGIDQIDTRNNKMIKNCNDCEQSPETKDRNMENTSIYTKQGTEKRDRNMDNHSVESEQPVRASSLRSVYNLRRNRVTKFNADV